MIGVYYSVTLRLIEVHYGLFSLRLVSEHRDPVLIRQSTAIIGADMPDVIFLHLFVQAHEEIAVRHAEDTEVDKASRCYVKVHSSTRLPHTHSRSAPDAPA